MGQRQRVKGVLQLYSLRCGDKSVILDCPKIMGIINVTPDSFFDGGKFYSHSTPSLEKIELEAEAMIGGGATFLDIGGSSSRPGAEVIGASEEIERVLPVVECLAQLPVTLSVDTFHAKTAKAVLEVGADVINDISGGRDPQMFEVIADSDCAYVIMHMQGNPQNMQKNPTYSNVVAEVKEYLEKKVEDLERIGVCRSRLIVDPGFGFGKTFEHNIKLFKTLESFRSMGMPLLVGLSRKSFLGEIVGRDVNERLQASVTAAVLAVKQGANIVRVHDVIQTFDGLMTLRALSD